MNEEEKLAEIKQLLDQGQKPASVPVRTFLSWFNAQRRGWWIVKEINEMLDYYGIATYPYFDAVYIDSPIEFIKKPTDGQGETTSTTTTTTTTKPPENISLVDGEDVLNYNDATYRIAKLEAANKTLVFVKPDSELSEAITKMITYDYSQLPVMQQPKRDLKGVISWRSIGSKLAVGQSTTRVRDLMEANYQLISSETSLFRALPTIIEHDYVLVENNAKEICGIVTASDLSLQFKQLTEPFLIVSEIENHIRYLLSRLPKEDIENAKDEKDTERVINNVADLTFGEYLRLFQNPPIWTKLSMQIDRKTFCDHLEKIRDIRNNIMHFDPDGLDEESIETLRRFARLLQTLRSIKAI
jgi:predicted transcriptional regulator